MLGRGVPGAIRPTLSLPHQHTSRGTFKRMFQQAHICQPLGKEPGALGPSHRADIENTVSSGPSVEQKDATALSEKRKRPPSRGRKWRWELLSWWGHKPLRRNTELCEGCVTFLLLVPSFLLFLSELGNPLIFLFDHGCLPIHS